MISEELNAAAGQPLVLHNGFKDAYLEVLRHVVAFEEAKTNAAMNHLRRVIARGVDVSDNLGVKIHSDLTAKKDTIGYLYGDLHCNSSAPWIAHQPTIQMIGEHLGLLGSEEDKTAFQTFVQKSSQFFKTPIAVSIRAPQVA